MATTQEDYYEILGVQKDAAFADIKSSYLKLARTLHPDVNQEPGAEDDFKKLGEAYEVLSDPEKRNLYDRYGHDGLRASAGAGGFMNMDPMDLFSSIFGFQTGPSGPPPGADQEVVLEISFRDSIFGVSKEVEMKGYLTCEECEGSGAEVGTSAARCVDCDGSGQISQVRQTFLIGQTMSFRTCNLCNGTGEYLPDPCQSCDGSGREIKKRILEVTIPGGVDNGSVLRIRGNGDVGIRGGQRGNLYVVIKVQPDPDFERVEYDLIKEVKISMLQAALGTELKVETLDGTKDIEVKPGTAYGELKQFKGLGVVKRDGKKRGSLYVRLVVETLESLSREERKLLKQVAKLRGEDVK